MIAREEYLKRYFTEEGVKSLTKRLTSLSELLIKKPNYPFKGRLYGFPLLVIHSLEHHQGMIDNMAQILNIDKVTLEVKNNGR